MARQLKGKITSVPSKRSSRETEKLFWSIRWDELWQKFRERDDNGNFKYKTAHDLAVAFTVGMGPKTRRRYIDCIDSAIGPVASADDKKRVAYLGNWAAQRAQILFDEIERDSLLFSSPSMMAMRETLRKYNDVMEIASASAEIMLSWVARYDLWSRQIDEHYNYALFDPKLSERQNKERFKAYTSYQRQLLAWMSEACDAVLRCFGIDEDQRRVLLQLAIVASREHLGDEFVNLIVSGMNGVRGKVPLRSGKAPGPVPDPFETDATLRKVMDSFIEKSRAAREKPEKHVESPPKEENSGPCDNKPQKVVAMPDHSHKKTG